MLKNDRANAVGLLLTRAEVRLHLLSLTFCLKTSGGGGADRDRTGDPLLAKQVLSQLSYSPVHRFLTDEGRRLVRSAAKKTRRGTVHDRKWWAWEESNFRPHPYQGCALTN